MSYSESEAILLLFSGKTSILNDYVDEVRGRLDGRGGEYKGPAPFPHDSPSKLYSFLEHLKEPDTDSTADADDFPDWLFRAASREETVDHLLDLVEANQSVMARRFRIYRKEAIQAALQAEPPEGVSAVAELDSREHSRGHHDPYTYDPNLDHVSEM